MLSRSNGLGKMANSGDMFESYVQYVYQVLLGAQGKNIAVSRRATVYDNHGNSYNIDVYYEFDVAGVHHRVAIECKDTRRPVERDDAIAFAGKIRDLPSTIGIFIARSGFQPAAKKYLRDHGIIYYAAGDLPQLGNLIASLISPICLPDELAVGQPFWTLMKHEDGHATGVWQLIPRTNIDLPGGQGVGDHMHSTDGVFPLFYSKPHAKSFHQLAFGGSSDICVRGIEQPSLRFLLLSAHGENRLFVIIQPFIEDQQQKFICEEWSARDLAQEYSVYDLSSQLENPREE